MTAASEPLDRGAARARARPRWPGWSHLPRDARDVLFVLALIGWTVAPHLARLPLWCGVLTAGVIVWRGWLAVGNAALPSRWWLGGVLALAVGLTFWTYGTLLGKDPGVTLLVVLMVLKTLELRARRDALVVFFLGFFVVLTHFLYSQSLAVAAAMLVSVWGLLTALVLAHMPIGRPPLRQAGALAARAALFGAPVMVLLFVLFPRIGPLWAVPQDSLAKTGLSGSLRMGGIAELAIDDSVAFRVRFAGPRPQPDALYWRGPVLTLFDGVEWQRSPIGGGPVDIHLQGTPIEYEMTLEPPKRGLLPLLDVTPDTPADAPRVDGLRSWMRPDLQWTTDRPVMERLRFTARAWTRFQFGTRESALSLREHLELPDGFNPGTIAWASALRRDPRHANADAAALATTVLDHIRAGFTYTLTPGTYGDTDPRTAIDEFWLGRKQGFCEHFATAFVVIMRALDVPARLVTGYQGADTQLQDGYVVVRQSNAHAWTEIWLPGRGWVRVDPTAAVAPERIELSSTLRPPPGLVAGALDGVNPALMAQWRAVWEGVNNQWNQWVLDYSRTRQFELLQRLGVRSPSWQDLAFVLIGLVCAASLGGAAWAFWDRHRRDPWERLQSRIRQRLAALGVPAAAHEGPGRLARRVRSQLGERAEALALQLERLERLRYGPGAIVRPDRAWRRDFEQAAARLAP